MDTEETAPEEKQRDSEAVAASAAARPQGGTLQPYREAYWDYLRALQASAAEAQRRSAEVYQRYTRALQDHDRALRDTLRRYQDSYQRYVTAARSGPSDVAGAEAGEKKQPESVAGAYQSHMATTQEVQQAQWDSQKGQEEAYREYVNALRHIWDPSVDDSIPQLRKRAYRSFLLSLQKVWGDLDADSIDPASLATLGQELITAAHHANAMARSTGW